MKLALSSVFFTSVLLSVVFAYPGIRSSVSQGDDEFGGGPIIVLSGVDNLDNQFGNDFFGSVGDPFNGFLASMRSMMDRLKQQIAQSIPNYSGHAGSFFGFNNIPEGANTTSTTKVIDGHLVTVNETTYSEGDDNQATVFRIRVIDVHPEDEVESGNPDVENITPDSDREPTTAPTNTDRSIESIEDFAGNEIPKSGKGGREPLINN